MGEKALKYGLLADMETCAKHLDQTLAEIALLKDSLATVQENSDMRARRSDELRARLENVRGEVSDTMNDLLSKMMGIDPKDVLSDSEITAHLQAAFQKFDKDNSGE
jgi:hypothetical protein